MFLCCCSTLFHFFGCISIYLTFVLVDTVCTLGGKKPVSAEIEHATVVQQYYALFEALTNVRDGAYYFHYVICLEIIEITLQPSP